MHLALLQITVSLLLQGFYIIGVLGLALYGLQALGLTYLFLRQQFLRKPWGAVTSPAPALTDPLLEWPKVTIQLPIYNEWHVVERLMDACATLDYPLDRLQIQVLDDSTDQTTAIAQRRAEHWQRQGVDITIVLRPIRQGFKAGALAHALPLATGDFIAIFDADFVPPRDFLQRTLPFFQTTAGATLGFVQSRWGHLNAAYSPLTRCQALALDGHFVVEQAGRQAGHYPMGFNGSGGIWRRACIEDPAVGGWQADTLCEDLDLSYRAQLAGWRAHFLCELEAPAEIPPQLAAFKRQQFRWAKGSIQTLRKVGGTVWQSEWPLFTRLVALIHLGNYLIHPLLLLLLLVTLPLLLADQNPGAQVALLSVASFGPPLLYAVAQVVLHRKQWWRQWSYLPLLTLLGTGVCFSNTLAVWEGLRSKGGVFLRTPKFRVETSADGWRRSGYRLPLDSTMIGEFILCIYALCTVLVALADERWTLGLFLAIYAGGFAFMLSVGLWQAWPQRDKTQATKSESNAGHPLAT
ncbi:MAG: glycosyltransferase [Caldilineaceae bacterium]|nr:glycosyltransferase [Caldilineaceae bacterium]